MPRLTLADLHRLPLPGMDVPSALAFSPDGRRLAFLHAGDGSNVQSLWRLDVVSGERTRIAGPDATSRSEATLDRAEQLRRERSRERSLGITEFHWAVGTGAGTPVLAAPRGGDVLIARGDGPAVPLGLSGVGDPRLAPAGDALAWVADRELHVGSLGPDGRLGEPRRLTHDAGDGITNGLAEYIAAEELGRSRGFWWNRAGTAILSARADETGIPPFHLLHLAGEMPEVETHRYPFAGGPNARVVLSVVRVDDGMRRDVDTGAAEDDYLARVVADQHDGWLVAMLPRRQDRLRWLRVAVDGTTDELWNEASTPWLNLDDDTRILDDGRILRSTEASGVRHLELRAPDGAAERVLTAGEWGVTGVAGVDEERGRVLFHGTRDGVLERHLYAVQLDVPHPVADPERLTVEPGWHEAAIALRGGAWTDRWSSLDSPPRVVLHPASGPELVIHAPAISPAEIGHAPPELTTVTAADGATELHAALYRPVPAGGSPPPVVVWVYGGPHSQKVANHWELTATPWRQLIRELGAAVLVVDNRGTAHRGLAFEAVLYGHLGEVEVADQLAALDQLAARGEIDASRAAITGGSYGGFMTIRCLLRHPDRFAAGVAWAPVVDWEGYDTAYTERYLGTPAENPDGYRSSSLRPDAGALRTPLLIQHGLVDENVHFRHTARLLEAFTDAGVSCDLQVFPTERHASRTPAALRERDRRAIAHLCRGLGIELPDGWEGTG